MSLVKLNITEPQEVIINGQTRLFGISRIDVSESLCKENDFIQCHKCKEYFDESFELGIYHPKYDERKENKFCNCCFHNKYKDLA